MKSLPPRPVKSRLLVIGTAALLAACLWTIGSAATTTPKKKAPAAKPAPQKPATAPVAPPAAPAPGPREMTELEFLSGKWEGKLVSFPLALDISIDGAVDAPGRTMTFAIHAAPGGGAQIGVEGDYSSILSYSTRHKALRAVVTDAKGHGVEMVGEKATGSTNWLFNSTSEGAPFPFKVRLTPVTNDQIVLDYSSGGRMPLKYEVTFNRVNS